MAEVTRQGDLCSGHGCFPPRPSNGASPDVFVNGLPAHRQGDGWDNHGCATCAPHGGLLAAGSSTVFVNGRPLGRVGDPVSCGSVVATGSPNVFSE